MKKRLFITLLLAFVIFAGSFATAEINNIQDVITQASTDDLLLLRELIDAELERRYASLKTFAENETEYVVASVMAEKTVSLIVFIAIFIAVRVALFALTFLTDAITSLPLLKQLNEVGGIIYGLAKSFPPVT